MYELRSSRLQFVPKFRFNYNPALVQIMPWRRPGDKSLFVERPTPSWRLRMFWHQIGAKPLATITLAVSSATSDDDKHMFHIMWYTYRVATLYTSNVQERSATRVDSLLLVILLVGFFYHRYAWWNCISAIPDYAAHPGYGFSCRCVNTILRPGGCFTNVSRALQNNLVKIYNARNHTISENFKLKLCPKHGFGHTYQVSARNSHKRYGFCNTHTHFKIIFGELPKCWWNNPLIPSATF